MRKANIIVIIFLLIAVAFFFYQDLNVTVIINDEGFSPDEITISKGTAITWTNQGEHLHWPASNFHPTHTIYPEKGGCLGSLLDACRGLKEGENFSFKFDKLGTWPMHDHLFPGLVMIVEVVDPVRGREGSQRPSASNEVDSSEFQKLDYGKQMNIIKSIAKDNPTLAWGYLKQSFIVNNQVVGNVHEFAHIIGNESYEKFGINGIKICDSTFAFGCLHGVTEAMLLREGLESVKSIELECLKLFPDQSINYTSCIHGTGHGLYSFEDGNLKRALLDCDIISEPHRQYCYDGVFMENSFAPESRTFDAKSPWKFCINLDLRFHRNCARYQSQIFLNAPGAKSSLNSAGENCALGSSLLLRETCYESLGYYVAEINLGKVADIWESCQRMSDANGADFCVLGAAKENIFQQYPNSEKSSNELCAKLNEPRKSECFSNIKNMINQNAVKN